MLIGLVGTVLPVLPGIVLIYVTYTVYGYFSAWQLFGLQTIILWGVVTILSLFIDYYGAIIGAQRSKSSLLGMWGSFAGAVIGLILFHLIGLVLGTFAGAVIGELMAGRPAGQALKSGKATLIGFLAGTLVKVIIALLMVGTFIWQVVG
jgi:uncharacterized protein